MWACTNNHGFGKESRRGGLPQRGAQENADRANAWLATASSSSTTGRGAVTPRVSAAETRLCGNALTFAMGATPGRQSSVPSRICGWRRLDVGALVSSKSSSAAAAAVVAFSSSS